MDNFGQLSGQNPGPSPSLSTFGVLPPANSGIPTNSPGMLPPVSLGSGQSTSDAPLGADGKMPMPPVGAPGAPGKADGSIGASKTGLPSIPKAPTGIATAKPAAPVGGGMPAAKGPAALPSPVPTTGTNTPMPMPPQPSGNGGQMAAVNARPAIAPKPPIQFGADRSAAPVVPVGVGPYTSRPQTMYPTAPRPLGIARTK